VTKILEQLKGATYFDSWFQFIMVGNVWQKNSHHGGQEAEKEI
jgi:hypothetical protein